MKQFGSFEDILDYAIKEEEAAAAFYTDLANKMDRPAMREAFEGFAREEQGHKEILLRVKAGGVAGFGSAQVADLKIGDFLVDVEPSADMDYQQALVLAMKKEKAAFRMYSELAEVAEDASLKETLRNLAQEEAKHKLRFEVEYDEEVLREN